MDLEKFRTLLRDLRYAELWITREGLVPLLFGVLIVTEGAAQLLELSKSWHVAALAVAIAATVLGWRLGRSVYWRWGSGRKVGVSFEGYKVPLEDWVEMRRELSSLCATVGSDHKIHLKLFPSETTRREAAWEKAERRYGIPILLRVSASPALGKSDEPLWEFTLRARYGQAIAHDFANALGIHCTALSIRRRPASLKAALSMQAANFFDFLLLHLGVIDYTNSREESAAAFLQHLDDRIKDRFPVTSDPRRTVRFMRALCLSRKPVYPGNQPPEAEELLLATDQCARCASEYGDEFPGVYNVLARNLFYTRDLERALQMTEKAISLAHREPTVFAVASLNRGVLKLFVGDYGAAAVALAAFFQLPESRTAFDWNDLAGFAKFAQEYGHKDAIYLRALYSRFATGEVGPDIRSAVMKWIAADAARNQLGTLLHTVSPLRNLPRPKQADRPKRRQRQRKGKKQRRK